GRLRGPIGSSLPFSKYIPSWGFSTSARSGIAPDQHLSKSGDQSFQRAQSALPHPLHQLAGLVELLHELVHVLHGRSAAGGDALAAAAVQDVVIAPLLERHRLDDRLDF